ncbi:hypothetical protein BN946_scf184799.g18 [Trametes cinnabarina]|uniref:BRCT domain-containing protein n=1 Tax=Pycnoporus cinnabarinus TaxID=5643 RepID=A0A060S2E8_PYCCI|nr:hypothetical protein BN946_scf184799.g18 [Trametes cinnabarina]
MRGSSVYSGNARSSSPPGRVLVEGTPSSSSRSNDTQSQSQAFRSHSQYGESQDAGGDTQLSDLFPPGQGESMEAELAGLVNAQPLDFDHAHDHGQQGQQKDSTQSQESYASTEPSSSYERLANQDPFSPVPEATQPAHASSDETQPPDYSTPSHAVDVSSIIRDHEYYNEKGQYVLPSVPSANRSSDMTRSSVPRGRLIELVAPHKRYRYQNVITSTNATAGPSTEQTTARAIANSSAGFDELAETQPPDVSLSLASGGDQTQPSVERDFVTVPRRTLPPRTRVLHALAGHQQSPKTDFVPDSEETRIVPDSDPPMPSPAKPATAQFSPVKPRSRLGLQSEEEVLRTVIEPAFRSVLPATEEEDEDEEEVPLAAAMQSAKAKGKRKASDPSASAEHKSPPSPAKKMGPAPLARHKASAQKSSSWKHAVVPSSDPREQVEDATLRPKSSKPRTPVEQIAPPLVRPRSAPRQAKLAAQARLHESSDEDEVKDTVALDQKDDGEGTQLADDDMDVDSPEVTAKPTRNGKRKRIISSSARKNSSKGNGARTPKENLSTPATRPTKRLKSASNARSLGGTATRVFALWKQDGHYYSGTVHSQVELGKYDIHFDDGDSSQVELKHMRACRLRQGDNVLLQGATKAVVVKPPSSGTAGHQPGDEVLLDLDEDGEESVQVQSIRLAPRLACEPTPSRLSAPSESSLRGGRKTLNKTGLVITFSPKYEEKERASLNAEIRRNGGVVLDDWTSLFAMDGTIAQKGNRWCLKADDIKWSDRKDVDRAFLVSDDYSHKPKYLLALALGIPCLSVEWVRQVAMEQTDVDWQPYLLPAGFSVHLDTRVSQLIDLDWGNSVHHLTEITDNPVPHKVFTGKSILCVSPLFVPCRHKTKKNSNGGQDSVPLITLCMGADTVEAVTDERHASHDIREYDYIVVRDKQECKRLSVYEHCVDMDWVKDCLISGRLVPLPSRSKL